MRKLCTLMDSILSRRAGLAGADSDCSALVRTPEAEASFCAIHAATRAHPVHLEIENSAVPGSYFLGKCVVKDSVLCLSDLRGDELKCAGAGGITRDETIHVQGSYLVNTLVHANSHDPGNPSEFTIRDSIALHYSNIHGAPVERCLLKPFATLDLTTGIDSTIGTFSYVNTGRLQNESVGDGRIWMAGKDFELKYSFHPDVLRRYINLDTGDVGGIFVDFLRARQSDFREVFSGKTLPRPCNPGSYANPYAVLKGECALGDRAFVAQRAYLENARLGDGANVQENCYIIDSVLEGNNVSAHGSKLICVHEEKNVFVGFNAFLRGAWGKALRVGEGCIVAPHTIIDLDEAVEIPAQHLVWGFIRNGKDLEANSVALDDLAKVTGKVEKGALSFSGNGGSFVHGFQHRVEHILEGNGALCTGDRHHGHAQTYCDVVFNVLHPISGGEGKGMLPSITIRG
ncbi:MAG: transferase [Desulfobacteraceae bacterium]|nr:transferase [Desulfobacteraceae bacterium]